MNRQNIPPTRAAWSLKQLPEEEWSQVWSVLIQKVYFLFHLPRKTLAESVIAQDAT